MGGRVGGGGGRKKEEMKKWEWEEVEGSESTEEELGSSLKVKYYDERKRVVQQIKQQIQKEEKTTKSEWREGEGWQKNNINSTLSAGEKENINK